MDEQTEQAASFDDVMSLLNSGEMTVRGLLPGSSNYTFLADICDDRFEGMAVYKPRQGETPLWDFPHGTLFQREMAAFQVSQALGWGLVPPTVMRVGPYGKGAVQFFVDADFSQHYFSFRDEEELFPTLMRVAAFDILINNADRKAGHVLIQESDTTDESVKLWGIDHGICFHVDPKLRTVIWEFGGTPIPGDLKEDMRALQAKLNSEADDVPVSLTKLLSPTEIEALRRRLNRLIDRATFPQPGAGRHYPWPPV